MTPDPLSTTFGALADPTRRAILARLAAGEASVTELAEPFDMSLPAVSRHLKVLQRAGLITRSRAAQWRPCHLAPEPLKGRPVARQPIAASGRKASINLADYLSDQREGQNAQRTSELISRAS